MTWAEDLLGVKDVVDGSGDVDVAMPRRSKLRVTGAITVSDDPTNGQTVLTVPEPEAGEVGAPADGRYVMAGYYDYSALPNAFGIVDGYCTHFVPVEGTPPDQSLLHFDARSPGVTARVYWPTVDDVPAGTHVLAVTPGYPPTFAGAKAIHNYTAIQIDVYAAQTFVGLEVPVVADYSVDTHTVSIMNISGVNVTLTHAGSQPDADLSAPFKITGAADHVLLPFKQCFATWDINNEVWVVLT